MDDLISRQAAIKLLKAKLAEIFFKETAEKNIEKWLNELPHFPFCSNCSKEVYSRELPNFCPNCGAKMESDNEV